MSISMEEPKGFNRNFESVYGHLKSSDFPSCIQWDNLEHLEICFPIYKRAQLEIARAKGAPPSKLVHIEGFDMSTPTKDQDLLVNTTLHIDPTMRAAVYGVNGTGKTLLFHNIATGQVKGFPKEKSTHHMQEMSMDPKADDVSVMETIVSSHPYGRILKGQELKLNELLAEGAKHEFSVPKLKSNLAYIKKELTDLDYYDAEIQVSKDLRVLGFDEKGEAAPMSSLSGGLRMRVALAAAFFIKPELLLLDEPTNHLDLPSVLWLENKLRGYKDSFLVVTHDRHLLENTVRCVLQLIDLKIKEYKCGFHEFEERKGEDENAMAVAVDKFLQRNRNLDPSSPEYRQKMRYQEWSEKRQLRLVAMAGKFVFKDAPALKCGKDEKQADVSLIKIEAVRFSYDPTLDATGAATLPYIFDTPVTYEIKQGTRVGIMGPNGAGKSTILKLITAKIFPTSGEVIRNPEFTLAYFGQHSTKELKMEETPMEFMTWSFPTANRGDIISHLEKTTINKSTQNTRMENLSFSQRSCIVFAKLTFVPPHLLIMDEPTNFLDLDSVDALISAANKFKGALMVVTHNRDFLKRTCKHFISLVPGAFLQFSSMKDAERATYSFIDALEKGEQVDHKSAIQENRGGGAIHTPEYLAAQEARRNKIASDAKKRDDAAAALQAIEDEKLAAKAAAAKAKVASQKLDWVAGDVCWVPVGTDFQQGTVVRNVPSMGVTVTLATGGNKLVDAKKLKQEHPGKSAAPAPTSKAAAGPRPQSGKGGKGAPTASNKGGKGQAQGKGKGKGQRS